MYIYVLYMILVVCVIPCIFSYEFNKLTILYPCTYISFIYMTNKSVMTFFCHKVSVCLPVLLGGGPRVVVSTAAFHARARLLERNKKCFFPIHVWNGPTLYKCLVLAGNQRVWMGLLCLLIDILRSTSIRFLILSSNLKMYIYILG